LLYSKLSSQEKYLCNYNRNMCTWIYLNFSKAYSFFISFFNLMFNNRIVEIWWI